jgi:hypothetical protein
MTTPSAPVCPSCGAAAAGKFCAECGATLQGAACAACRAPLTPGARFCHRCGTPAGITRSALERHSGVGNALPWAVAAIALLALIALAAGQRFGRTPPPPTGLTTPAGTPLGDAPARAPDISSMTPTERAERLYDRVMSLAERGRADSVQFFMPMALQAYEAIGPLNLDQRYDLGRLAEVGGDASIAAAQADTILRAEPRHLLGLLLASRAARLGSDQRKADHFLEQLAQAEPRERARQLPEYLVHQNDIDTALAEYRRQRGR